jgi:hypothetical protein
MMDRCRYCGREVQFELGKLVWQVTDHHPAIELTKTTCPEDLMRAGVAPDELLSLACIPCFDTLGLVSPVKSIT